MRKLAKKVLESLAPGSIKSVAILAFFVLLLRDLPYICLLFQPFRTFDSFIHELCHALACLASGGTVNWMKLGAGGVTDCSCGNAMLVCQAGYLGQSAIGGALIVLSRYKQLAKPLLLSIGIAIGLANLFFVRDKIGITWAFLLGSSLCFAGMRVPATIAQTLVLFIAVQTALYIFGDVELVLEHSLGLVPTIKASDATHAYHLSGVAPYVWSLIWCANALVFVTLSLYMSYRLEKSDSKKKSGK